MTYCEILYCFEKCFNKNTKNNSEKLKKRAFWDIFGPITQPEAIFFKKTFKLIEMTMVMPFRGNLRKMFQQISVNLDKNAILG